jgi:hypothetical protein
VLHGGNGNDLVYALDHARDTIDGGTGTDPGTWDTALDIVSRLERRL